LTLLAASAKLRDTYRFAAADEAIHFFRLDGTHPTATGHANSAQRLASILDQYV
jgi:lysophospholipase L1-like esterase